MGLFLIGNIILYICICAAKHDTHTKVYMDEMTVLNADGCLETQPIDDSMSNTGSVKSSVADREFRPLTQLAGIVIFLVLYMLMWASGAFSIAMPFDTELSQVDVIVSFLYMILCIILGIFLVVFYCLARNDTRATWHTCCKKTNESTSQPPRSNTNINVISHANAHNSLKRDDSCSSLQTSSMDNQANPLMQIMQYHKKAAMSAPAHSVACSNSRGDASVQGSPDDAPVFYNPRQNGVAKRYWERQRASRETGMDSSMMSVPSSGHGLAHSPTNTEPTQHMSIEIQIKSHHSKQARRHRLGSTNSEPADVRNNIYHSMPKSPPHLNIPSAPQNRRREPTIGQSRTPSEGGTELKQFYKYPPEMWQNSVPRNYNHMTQNAAPHMSEYMRQPAMSCESERLHQEPLNAQPYVHGYLKSMKDVDSDDESQYSHRSRRSAQQRSRQRPRHRYTQEGEGSQATPAALTESYISLQSHGTARSHHSSRSARSGHRHRNVRTLAEERPLLPATPPVKPDVDEDKLNINHSSSDNNSSHYACTPLPEETKKINNMDMQVANTNPNEVVYSVPQQQRPCDLRVDVDTELSALEMCIPEEGIYENARNVFPHERPVYTNLEEIRKQAAAVQAAKSPEPQVTEYELPIYENLFSLNEYDTLKKQKHHVNKGLPSRNQVSSNRDLSTPQNDFKSPQNDLKSSQVPHEHDSSL